MDHIAEIKNRLPIEEIVSQYVQLKKVGRNFKGLCPFHNERTPSFYVSTDKQLAYCFGCRKGGDHFKFIQEIEGIDFTEALKLLADKARIELPTVSPQAREKIREQKSRNDRLLDMHTVATAFFEKQLWGNLGSKALDYIRSRGLQEATIRHFHLGYAGAEGSGDSLLRGLINQGYSKEECEESGLVLARNTDASMHFDRFRNRLMFPISTPTGKICAFGGRALAMQDEPKYLNSPETPIYHKSSVLYGFAEAKNAIRALNSVVVVEGYMDLIAAYQAGVHNIVATSGTALTKEHLEIIKRQSDRLIFSFDADAAGKQATLRGIELALSLGFTLSIAVWSGDEKDPDALCKVSPDRYLKAIDKPQSLCDFLIAHSIALHGIETPEQRVSCAQELIPFIARIESPLFLDEWIKQASVALSVSVTALYDELKHFRKKKRSSFQEKTSVHSIKTSIHSLPEAKKNHRSEYLLGLLLTYPSTISLINQIMVPEIFLDQELQSVYISLLDQYNQCLGGPFAFTEPISPRAEMLMLYVEQMQSDAQCTLSEHDAAHEVVSVALQLARTYIAEQKNTHLAYLKKAISSEDKERILSDYNNLLSYEYRLSSLT